MLLLDLSIYRLNECILPHDKEAVMDYLEILDFNLRNPISKSYSIAHYLRNNGIQITFNLLQTANDDEMSLALCLHIFASLVSSIILHYFHTYCI
jgi:hypothetical protein